MELQLSLLLLSIIVMAAAEVDVSRCPPHIRKYAADDKHHYIKTYQEKCYEFYGFNEKKWVDARDYCQSSSSHNPDGWHYDGRMVEIYNHETMMFIKNALHAQPWTNNGVWNGANDRETNKRWHWTSGNRLNYTYWARGEPETSFIASLTQDCAVMWRDDQWRWKDKPCGGLYKYKFICQYEMKPLPTTTTGAPNTTTTGDNDNFPGAFPGLANPQLPDGEDAQLSKVKNQGNENGVQHHESNSKNENSIHFSIETKTLIFLVIGAVIVLIIVIVIVSAIVYRRRSRKRREQASAGNQTLDSQTHDMGTDGGMPRQTNPIFYESRTESVSTIDSGFGRQDSGSVDATYQATAAADGKRREAEGFNNATYDSDEDATPGVAVVGGRRTSTGPAGSRAARASQAGNGREVTLESSQGQGQGQGRGQMGGRRRSERSSRDEVFDGMTKAEMIAAATVPIEFPPAYSMKDPLDENDSDSELGAVGGTETKEALYENLQQ